MLRHERHLYRLAKNSQQAAVPPDTLGKYLSEGSYCLSRISGIGSSHRASWVGRDHHSCPSRISAVSPRNRPRLQFPRRMTVAPSFEGVVKQRKRRGGKPDLFLLLHLLLLLCIF